MLHFTCGEKKVWQSIKKSQNSFSMTVGLDMEQKYSKYKKVLFCRNDSVKCRHVFKPQRVSKCIEILSIKFSYFLRWC